MQEHITFCDRLKSTHLEARDKTIQAFKNHPVRTIASIGFTALISASFAVSKENSCATIDGCKAPAMLAAAMGASIAVILLISGVYTVKFIKGLTCASPQR